MELIFECALFEVQNVAITVQALIYQWRIQEFSEGGGGGGGGSDMNNR